MNYFIDNPLVTIQLIAAWRVLVACLLGAMLGFERSLAGKHAGMRTYALVAMGAALFTCAGVLIEPWSFGSSLDPSRIAAAVVIGIGFIGSGLAFLRNEGNEGPGELTTAAGIWVAAGIGVAAGFGLYVLAILTTVVTTLVFTALWHIEHTLRKRLNSHSL